MKTRALYKIPAPANARSRKNLQMQISTACAEINACFLILYRRMKPIAKYIQIAKTLQRDILSGKYEHEERFPSEESLARRFGASRPTIERALRELKRAGLLQSRAGSGSYLTFAARNATGQ